VLSRRLGLSRQWLHARSLSFEHPATGDWLTVVSPFPADLQHALDVLDAEL
jgi:23S rRNA pseudouridine1911/1915/1917 synthase